MTTTARRSSDHARGLASLAALFVILVLIAMVAVPMVTQDRATELRGELERTAEPARSAITNLHVWLSQAETRLRDYVETGDTLTVAEFREAAAEVRATAQRLSDYAGGLGGAPRATMDSVIAALATWSESAEELVVSPQPRTDARHHVRYAEMLNIVAHMDSLVSSESATRRQRITAAEHSQTRILIVLALLAIPTIIAVVLLTQRAHRYAAAADNARSKVEALMESRARLTRGLSHDLKNPLNAIDGHAQLLEQGLRGELNPDQQHSVERIRTAAASLLALVEDIVALAISESGEIMIEPETTSIAKLLQQAIEEHAASAERKGLRIQKAIDPELPPVRTDPARARQVVDNMLTNAIKYTPAGGVVTVAATYGVFRAARSIAIGVRDTGPGIAQEDQERVFDEFTRLDRSQPGAGLGLAIARNIARLLGGDITLDTAPGQGATFTFWLPLHDATSADRVEAGEERHGSRPRGREQTGVA